MRATLSRARARAASRPARLALKSVASLAVIAVTAVIVFFVPRATGSTWRAVLTTLHQLSLLTAFFIAALWIGGLAVYTIAMTASMPGLTHRRALALNLAGSSVSSLFPFGGVVGVGLSAAMVRSWRLSIKHLASSTAVLNVVNIVSKLVLPVIAGVIISSRSDVTPWLGRFAGIASVATALIVAAVVWALRSRSWAPRIDRLLHRTRKAGAVPTCAGSESDGPGPVVTLQRQVREVFRFRWAGLMTGMTGYILAQWALFALCLHTAQVHASIGAAFAAFAVERALTLAVITPAGAGIAEAGAATLLVALGSPPAAAAAGVLLYRLFVYLAEIPVGALVLAGWASLRLTNRRREAAAA